MIKMRNEGKTLQEIGETFRISRERVRQILTKYMPEYKSKLGLKQGTVKLVRYNPEWEILYKAEEKIVLATIDRYIFDIAHIGSTSIPGMYAKPIIHILVAVKSLSEAKQITPLLSSIGYGYSPLPFKAERIFFVKGPKEKRLFHLSLVEKDSPEWVDSILFCEYLRTHKEDAKKYSKLKLALAKKYKNDRNSYTAEKQKFIKDIIEKAHTWNN